MTSDKSMTKPELVDGENNPVVCDQIIHVKRDIPREVSSYRARSNDDLAWLPMSGLSAGTGIFQVSNTSGASIAGIKVDSPAMVSAETGSCNDLRELAIADVIIDTQRNEVCCGCGLTLEQLNQVLADTLGPNHQVLGADLTSFQYATVGASFMTGGMGPQRRYFSDSVTEIALYDGERHSLVTGDNLRALAGTYGWTGMVTAVRCRFFQLPQNEVAIALPVSNEAENLARLLACFAPHCYLDTDTPTVSASGSADSIILGIEHVTIGSMQPLFRSGATDDILKRARSVEQNCRNAGVEGVVFISGYTDQSVDELLEQLIDDAESEIMTLAGIDIEHAEIFSSAEEMRQLREAIPYAARMQKGSGRHAYKSHTDATLRLPIDAVESAMTALWLNNMDYIKRVEAFFKERPELHGDVIIYGHLNPFGVDPHNRVTCSCDDETLFAMAKAELDVLKRDYYRSLKGLCEESGIQFIGGEKMSDSERVILQAYFEQGMQPPGDLQAKHHLQKQAIASAPHGFSWRALPPYLEKE